MIFVQLSDTHISDPGSKQDDFTHMSENLLRCVEDINQLDPKPELVLVTGDVASNGTKKAYLQASRLLDQLEMPYFVVPGNHDERINLLSAFGEAPCPNVLSIDNKFLINYVVDDYEIRFIGLDSKQSYCSGGELCDNTLKWLDKQLAKDTEKPTVIFMHHPPVKLSILETDEDGFIGVEGLATVIKKYNNIERILCGHVHLQTFMPWHNTIVSTAPSTGMELQLDLTMEKPSQFLLEKPVFQVHNWTAEKTLISYLITADYNETSYLF